MNKSFYKLTFSLVLIIVALIITMLLGAFAFIGVWLHTYKAFTQEKLTAEITVSEQKIDERGEKYFEIEYREVDDESAFVKMFFGGSDDTGFESTETFLFYGDMFEVGGQVIKFENWAVLVGFDTIYKVTSIEGDYIDVNEAKDAPERSIEELNGGVDEQWKFLQENEDNLSFLVDTVYVSSAGKFVLGQEKSYGLYITEDGFVLEAVGHKP